MYIYPNISYKKANCEMDLVLEYVLLCSLYWRAVLSKVIDQFMHNSSKTLLFSHQFQILHFSSCWHIARFGCSSYVGIESNLSDTSRSSICKNHRSGCGCYHCSVLRILLPCLANSWIVGKFNFQLGVIIRCTWWRRWRKQFIVIVWC